jgi:hypothetical protein
VHALEDANPLDDEPRDPGLDRDPVLDESLVRPYRSQRRAKRRRRVETQTLHLNANAAPIHGSFTLKRVMADGDAVGSNRRPVFSVVRLRSGRTLATANFDGTSP